MEKIIGETKFVFKDQVTMLDRQKCLNALKKQQTTQDEMQLCFDLFPIFCVSINDQQMTDEQKVQYIQNLTDLGLFTEISNALAECETALANGVEKKKINSNINLTSETTLEK